MDVAWHPSHVLLEAKNVPASRRRKFVHGAPRLDTPWTGVAGELLNKPCNCLTRSQENIASADH